MPSSIKSHIERGFVVPVWVNFGLSDLWYAGWTDKGHHNFVPDDYQGTMLGVNHRDVLRPRDPNNADASDRPNTRTKE